jgi:hypothetical protein
MAVHGYPVPSSGEAGQDNQAPFAHRLATIQRRTTLLTFSGAWKETRKEEA